MKKVNKRKAAFSEVGGAGTSIVTPARAKSLTGKVVNSNPKHRRASRSHTLLSQQPIGATPSPPIINKNIAVAYIAKHLKEKPQTNALLQGREGKLTEEVALGTS